FPVEIRECRRPPLEQRRAAADPAGVTLIHLTKRPTTPRTYPTHRALLQRLVEYLAVAGIEHRGRGTGACRGRVVEQHGRETEQRLFLSEVTVTEAIDRYVHMPRKQRTGSQRLESVEELVRIRHLL